MAGRYPRSVELLERAIELDALAGALASAMAGQGRCVVVAGEPGIGKTTLLARLAGDAPAALVGHCDDLAIRRPLAPLRDIGGRLPTVAAAIAAEEPAHTLHARLLSELARRAGTVVVFEDVHWADQATIDVVSVIGRRIESLPIVLALSVRSGEAPPGHALHAALAAVPPAALVRLDLAPLSRAAVGELAGSSASAVHAITGGNPFLVQELLAAGAGALPASVSTSVLGRVARLGEDARDLTELIAVVPGRTRADVLDLVLPRWRDSVEEPERRGLLEVGPGYLRFRHELARHAVVDGLSAGVRQRLHGRILEALVALDADPAEVVHHAEAAGATAVVARHAPIAARRAAAVGSTREACLNYRRARVLGVGADAVERARLAEEHALQAYLCGELAEAFAAIDAAIDLQTDLGDDEGVGRARRILSRLHWYAGDGAAARAAAAAAVAVLSPLGETVELARAYATLAQLAMLADDDADAIAHARRAVELATALGDDGTRIHAEISTASALANLDARDPEPLLRGHASADAAGDAHEAVRALGNLAFSEMRWALAASAMTHAVQAEAYGHDHEVPVIAAYMTAVRAWLRLRAGDWSGASALLDALRPVPGSVVELVAATVRAELALRRGDDDARDRLGAVDEVATCTREPQRMGPILELVVEHAYLSGANLDDPRPVAALPGFGVLNGHRLRGLLRLAGVDAGSADSPLPPASPYARMIDADWHGAAEAFAAVGWAYDRALCLSRIDRRDALEEALQAARELGAAPLIALVTRRLASLGFPVPRGPRPSTRASPGGLTRREAEVLELLTQGFTNAEIGRHLVVSTRTAEHHVAAIMRKLGVATRRDAARRAATLDVTRR